MVTTLDGTQHPLPVSSSSFSFFISTYPSKRDLSVPDTYGNGHPLLLCTIYELNPPVVLLQIQNLFLMTIIY